MLEGTRQRPPSHSASAVHFTCNTGSGFSLQSANSSFVTSFNQLTYAKPRWRYTQIPVSAGLEAAQILSRYSAGDLRERPCDREPETRLRRERLIQWTVWRAWSELIPAGALAVVGAQRRART